MDAVSSWSSWATGMEPSVTGMETAVAPLLANPTGAPFVLAALFFLASTCFGVMRGFSREVLGVLGWVAAVVAGVTLWQPFANWAFPAVHPQAMAELLAFAALFALTFVASRVLTRLFSRMILRSPLAGLDRLLGGVFGAVRGGAVVVLVAFVCNWLQPLTGLASFAPWAGADTTLSGMVSHFAPTLPRFGLPGLAPQAGSRHDLAEQGLPGGVRTRNPDAPVQPPVQPGSLRPGGQ